MRPLPAPCRALRVLPALLFLAMPHAGGRSPDAVAGRGLGVDVSFGSLLSPARRELAVGPPSCRTHGQSEVLWTDPHRSMGLAFTLGHRSGSVVGFAPRGSLRLRGGAEDESDMTYPFFAVREQPGRSERVLSLLRQNMTDAEILSHPTLRGHCITSEILVSARKEWDGDGKSVREVEQRLNEVTMASARRVRGNATEDEIRRWRAKAVRAFDERDGKTHGRDDAPDEGAGEGGWEQGTPLTKDTLPAYMAANAHRFEAQVGPRAHFKITASNTGTYGNQITGVSAGTQLAGDASVLPLPCLVRGSARQPPVGRSSGDIPHLGIAAMQQSSLLPGISLPAPPHLACANAPPKLQRGCSGSAGRVAMRGERVAPSHAPHVDRVGTPLGQTPPNSSFGAGGRRCRCRRQGAGAA